MENECLLEKSGLNTADIEAVEAKLLEQPQVECPLDHWFAPGVYIRQVTMPKDSVVIGHQHKTAHFNIVTKGHASVYMDGELHDIKAPCTFVSNPGVRKILYMHEDTVWQTVHPTNETDLLKLEEELITKSEGFQIHQELIEQLKLKGESK